MNRTLTVKYFILSNKLIELNSQKLGLLEVVTVVGDSSIKHAARGPHASLDACTCGRPQVYLHSCFSYVRLCWFSGGLLQLLLPFFSFLNLTLPLCVCHACISDQQSLNPHPPIFILYLIANPSSIPSVSSQHQQHLLFDCVLPLTCPPFYSERELVLVKSHSRIVTYLKLLIKPAIFERLHNCATSL